jgi:hypothetical protein
MDDDILTIGLFNLIFGVFALTLGYISILPRDHLPAQISTPVALAIGER